MVRGVVLQSEKVCCLGLRDAEGLSHTTQLRSKNPENLASRAGAPRSWGSVERRTVRRQESRNCPPCLSFFVCNMGY